MKSDRSPEKRLQLLKEAVEVVGDRKLKSVGIHHGLVPLIGWTIQELTRIEQLAFRVRICISIANQKMYEFHFECREEEGGARKGWRRG